MIPGNESEAIDHIATLIVGRADGERKLVFIVRNPHVEPSTAHQIHMVW